MNVYIVWFHTGEYEDKRTEINSIYSRKAPAERAVKALRARLDIMKRHDGGNNDYSNDPSFKYDGAQLDNHRIDFTGAYITMSGPHEVEDI